MPRHLSVLFDFNYFSKGDDNFYSVPIKIVHPNNIFVCDISSFISSYSSDVMINVFGYYSTLCFKPKQL